MFDSQCNKFTNGNLLTDSGKGVTGITYNYLNLPQQITTATGTITYSYTATGQKLRMTVPPSGAEGAKTVDYAAGLVYENNALAFIPTAEGRILPPTKAVNPEVLPGDANALKNSFYRYEYHLKDHLGNLRVACRCAEIANATSPRDSYAPIAVQENHYDAWGLSLPLIEETDKLAGSPEHRWQYNGKEKVVDLNWYEYGFRWYSPEIARFLQVDPLAMQYPFKSTYDYAENKPVNSIDLDGLEAIFFGQAPWLVLGEAAAMPRPIALPRSGGIFDNIARTPIKTGESSLVPTSSTPTQEHHINPQQHKGNEIVKEARDDGFKQDGKENKIDLEKYNKEEGTGQHGGSHPEYNKEVGKRLDKFRDDNPIRQKGESLKFVRDMVKDLKKTIEDNPTKKVNDLFKSQTLPDNTRVITPVLIIPSNKTENNWRNNPNIN